MEEKRMAYRDYKRHYANCETVRGSYDTSTKTIVVLVPVSMMQPKRSASRRLRGILWPLGGIFVPVSSGAGERQKSKTSVKAIYRPVERLLASGSIPILPRP